MAVAEREHAAVEVVDLASTSLRELNQRLHDLAGGAAGPHFRIVNPSGAHAVACGLDAGIEVEIDADPAEIRRYGSARQLYNFSIDNAAAY